MKEINYLQWFRLLNKRFFRKVSFLVLLLLIPVLTIAASLSSSGEGGMVTIALCAEDPADTSAQAVIDTLTGQKSMIRFQLAEDAEDAEQAVRSAQADAAWILSEDLSGKLSAFTAGTGDPAVRIVEREDTVFLKLTREKLYAALYPQISRSVFRSFLAENFDSGSALPPEEMERYYASSYTARPLIAFSFSDSMGDSGLEDENYLAMPVRGILAVMLTVLGMAASMYLQADIRAGMFTWLPRKHRPVLYGLYHLIAAADAGAVILAALALSGSFTAWYTELPLMALLVISTAGVCNLLRCALRDSRLLGVLIPIVSLCLLVLCPVFLNFRQFRLLQHLLPPFYYLNALHSAGYFGQFALFTLAVLGANGIVGFLAVSREID